jgi:RNA polymerase-interacting CarD/CdnL/TRCF family regulator
MEQKKKDHMTMIKQRRQELSELFESPEPIKSAHVIAETGTTKYVG